MTQSTPGPANPEHCPKCGKAVGGSIRPGGAKAESAGESQCSCASASRDEEMNLRFSRLKEAGRGTVFITGSSAPDSAAPAFVGLAQNAIIGGVYKIIRLIGRGGMGEVYQAQHLTLGKNCALKVIPPDQVTEVSWQRFLLEAKTIARLEHVNLVRVTDLGIHENCLPYYAMEFLEGKNLAEMLSEFGPMPLDKAVEVFVQVCDGVECAHKDGILHRDLKPANIMLTRTAAGKLEVKVLDFGLAKLTKHDRFRQSLTTVGDVFGSPSYMSPEQCSGEDLDIRSDIYAIGCTLFESLVGRPPFYSHVPSAVFFGHLESEPPTLAAVAGEDKFPPGMEAVMAKLLRKDPDQRYQTLAELRTDLQAVVSGQDISALNLDGGKKNGPAAKASVAPPTTPKTATQMKRQQNLRVLALSGFILLIVAGSMAYLNYLTSNNTAQPKTGDTTGPLLGKSHELSPESLEDSTSNVPEVSPVNPADQPDGEAFYKGFYVRAGSRFRHYLFPKVLVNPNYFQYGMWPSVKQVALSGELLVPAWLPVCFIPVSYIADQPFILKHLGDGDFSQVDLLRRGPETFFRGIAALTKFKSVNSVTFGDMPAWDASYPKAGARAIELINQFPNLERLIAFAPLSAESLAQLSRLKSLTELRLQGKQPDLPHCLKLVGGSGNLRSFAASSGIVADDDLATLSTCPRLNRLFLGKLPCTHAQLAQLAKFPALVLLEVPDLAYRPDLVSDLRQLKNLRELRFSRASWTADNYRALTQPLPTVRMVMYRNAADLDNVLNQP